MTENRPRALMSILMNSFSLLIRYLREKNYEESARETLLYAIVKPIFFGGGESDGEQKEEDPVDIEAVKCPGKQREVACLKNDLIIKAMKLLLCLVGLLASFLTWGVLQEKIITQQVNSDSLYFCLKTKVGILQYVDSSGKTGRFKDSEFLVLVNRIVGFTVSLTYLILCPIQQPRHRVPLYKYSFSSLSSIMSSWFQYESLKFVSFPTQVIKPMKPSIALKSFPKCLFRCWPRQPRSYP